MGKSRPVCLTGFEMTVGMSNDVVWRIVEHSGLQLRRELKVEDMDFESFIQRG